MEFTNLVVLVLNMLSFTFLSLCNESFDDKSLSENSKIYKHKIHIIKSSHTNKGGVIPRLVPLPPPDTLPLISSFDQFVSDFITQQHYH